MKKEFTKQDLQTGDIIVQRCGAVGVVILEKDMILYQNCGSDFLDVFTDDLRESNDDRNYDIVEVYSESGPLSFYDYMESIPVYEREDDGFGRTDPESFKKSFAEKEAEWEARSRENENRASARPKNKDFIVILGQYFYGSGASITEIEKNEFDRYLLGVFSDSIKIDESEIDRSYIDIPGSDNLVIVYNKYQEEDNKSRNIKPTVSIPEKGITLHSRCFICRINRETNELEDFENAEDYQKVKQYLL